MLSFHLGLSNEKRAELEVELEKARQAGDLAWVNRVLSMLLFAEGLVVSEIGRLLRVSGEAVRAWFKRYLVNGAGGLRTKKSPGRPPKLCKSQRLELAQIIDKGPAEAGFTGNCWRSPMIQELIHKRFCVFYNVRYISELLKSMGYSYQKARFVSDHLDPEKRAEWLNRTWPQILKLAQRKNAYLLFGDEASFPQWGSLSYTWAKQGQQPTIKTSGKRKGYKVFGLIDYFTGRSFFKCQEERLNSETYAAYLKEVLNKTRKHIVLVQDGARYHTSARMKAFFEEHKQRLTVFNLPSYSPDYNPIEKLWKKVKQKGIHLHYFPTFESLKEQVDETLSFFGSAKKEVLSLFEMYRALA
jgi:transposase